MYGPAVLGPAAPMLPMGITGVGKLAGAAAAAAKLPETVAC